MRRSVFSPSDPAETHLVGAPEGFGFPLSSLYSALCSPPCSDQTTLLLYLLLHKNTAFRHFVLSRTDLDALVSSFTCYRGRGRSVK